jgi:hypothetical protein
MQVVGLPRVVRNAFVVNVLRTLTPRLQRPARMLDVVSIETALRDDKLGNVGHSFTTRPGPPIK